MTLKLAQWSFLLLVFSIPFPRPFNVQFGGMSVPYTDLIFPFVLTLTMIALWQKQITVVFDRVFVLLACYAAAITVAAFLPDAVPLKLFGEYYLFVLCAIAFVLCSATSLLKKAVIIWLVATALAVLASMAGVVLFYSGSKTEASNYFLSHLGSLPAGDYPRVQGLFGNPNMLCNYLNVSVCLLLVAGSLGWLSRRTAWILFGGILIAGAFTISPGLGGVALSLGLWFGSRYGELSTHVSRTALVIGVFLATVMLAVTLVSPETGNTRHTAQLPLSNQRIEPSVRVLIWENVIERVEPHLLLGKGTGALTAGFVYTQLSGDQQVLTDAHNIYLNVLGQSGLVGVAAFVIFVIGVTRRCSFGGGPVLAALSCAFIGAFIYQGLSGSFEDARHLWILIGILLAVSRLTSTDDTLRASTGPLPHPST
jgi:O-antigen ligase